MQAMQPLAQVAMPSQPPDDHKINWSWPLFYVIFYVISVAWGASAGYFGNIIWFPLVFLTSIVIYMSYKYHIKRGKLNPRLVQFADIFRGYSHSFFGGGIFALFTELWISTVAMLAIVLIFGQSRALTAALNEDYDGAKAQVCSNPLVHLYLAFSSFCVAGFIEEFIKAYLLQYVTKLYLPHTSHLGRGDIDTFVWLGMCIGLGFGTMEGVLYVCIYGGSSGFWGQLILWLIRALVAIPFHSITGFMWGTQLARRECSKQTEKTWVKMGYQQVLLHGLYDFIEMELVMDFICASSAPAVSPIVSIGVAILYTLGSALIAGLQYKNLMKNGNGQDFVPDIEYHPHSVNN